jgi:hypothetical protein
MAYRSNLAAVRPNLAQATAAGLIAAAEVVIGRVKQALRGGYTSGAFVTGRVMASVNRNEPATDERGAYILVGTDVTYALFWEVGHHNLFTRKFERQERWMPAFLDSRNQQRDAFLAAFTRTLGPRT